MKGEDPPNLSPECERLARTTGVVQKQKPSSSAWISWSLKISKLQDSFVQLIIHFVPVIVPKMSFPLVTIN